jgi:hypothetical protein
VKTATHEPPESALHKACAYSLNHWEALTRFLKDGRLALDNNIAYAELGIAQVMPTAGLCRVLGLGPISSPSHARPVVADAA